MGNTMDLDGTDYETAAFNFAKAEAGKPVDASDIADLAAARAEIVRLRQAAIEYRRHTAAARRLQAVARMRRERQELSNKKGAIVKLQSVRRSHEVRKVIRRQSSAALLLQAHVRGRIARKSVGFQSETGVTDGPSEGAHEAEHLSDEDDSTRSCVDQPDGGKSSEGVGSEINGTESDQVGI